MEPSTKRRRVPQGLRKRSERSCDYCRKHRCKCEPIPDQDTCSACRLNGTACVYATPRRTRVSISLDELTDRYRCLEAIVKGAFPNEPTVTSEELVRLGMAKGFSMPDLSDRSAVRPEDVLVMNPPTRREDHSSPATDTIPTLEADSTEVPESPSLVRDTAGQSHHIGPSGSLAFFAELRALLSSRQTATPGLGLPPSSSFVRDDAAQTLEAADHLDTEDGYADGADLARPSPGSAISPSFSREEDQRCISGVTEHIPPASIMIGLLQSFFELVHPDFLLFHRATFEEEFEAFVLETASTKLARVDLGWIACLHMMLVFGSLSGPNSDDAECRALRKRSLTAARSLLPRLVSKCSLVNIQALMLISFYLHNHSERNAAWNLIGTAIRMALALGMHKKEVGRSFRLIERETRKRVFCTLYGFEQFLCTSLGRPSGLDAPDIDVSAPRNGFFDGIGMGSSFTKLELDLQAILASARAPCQSPKHLLEALKIWVDSIPSHFNLSACVSISDLSTPSSTPRTLSLEPAIASLQHHSSAYIRSVLLLHIQHHYVAILATRSLLLRSVARCYGGSKASVEDTNADRSFSENSLNPVHACVYHACQLAALIILMHSFHVLNGVTGLDVFYGYQAAMVLLLQLLHPQPAAQSGSNSRPYLTDIIARLRSAVRSTRKCATMHRFASVMESFAEAVMSNQLRSTIEEHPHDQIGATSSLQDGAVQSSPLLLGSQPPIRHAEYVALEGHRYTATTRTPPFLASFDVNESGTLYGRSPLSNEQIRHAMGECTTFLGNALPVDAFDHSSALSDVPYVPNYNDLLDWANLESFLAGANFT